MSGQVLAGFDVQHAPCPNSPGHPLTVQGLPPISGSRIRPFAPELEGIIWNSANWIFKKREALKEPVTLCWSPGLAVELRDLA